MVVISRRHNLNFPFYKPTDHCVCTSVVFTVSIWYTLYPPPLPVLIWLVKQCVYLWVTVLTWPVEKYVCESICGWLSLPGQLSIPSSMLCGLDVLQPRVARLLVIRLCLTPSSSVHCAFEKAADTRVGTGARLGHLWVHLMSRLLRGLVQPVGRVSGHWCGERGR